MCRKLQMKFGPSELRQVVVGGGSSPGEVPARRSANRPFVFVLFPDSCKVQNDRFTNER